MSDKQIRTRADGSIDTAYYLERGRRMRSEAARDMIAAGRIRGASPKVTATAWSVMSTRLSGFRSLWRWV